ncbi:Alpha/Beta hydrolase protein [Mycena maculata]|uniref:Alpha/Beta hydrolase protein n=1 Tax=Mycena maculata TaxID=230809 RepID=A0AAD7MLW2_9AGAR|nr:Alpha/Beta hydrolase protein [Mycena maculata]
MYPVTALFLLLTLRTSYAAPQAYKRAVTSISASQLSDLTPYIQFARSAYCPTDLLETWECDEACDAIPGFQPTLVGGNDDSIQDFFVGYWPSEDSIVVAHEGTDPTEFLSILTDVEFVPVPLDTTLFPGVSSDVAAHSGFLSEHALTAPQILAQVAALMQSKGTNMITLVGHSLGGALAELDALYLSLNLPSTASINVVTFGKPRVGNPAFAALIDSLIPNFQRVNNELDLVPIVPGRSLGFQHAHGEIHLISENDAIACPGDDDATDTQCQILSVPNILEGDILDHLGPYQGIYIGTLFCT